MQKLRALAAILVAPMLALAVSAHAQSTWDNAIKTAEHVGPLKDGLFGDSINFNSGALSFDVGDLSIPGNSVLPVAVGRTYVAELDRMKAAAPKPGKPQFDHVAEPRKYLFGDWDLDLPHIAGTFDGALGWQNDSTTPLNRCSVIGQVQANGAPATGQPKSSNALVEVAFWRGNQLRANGKSEALLLAKVAATPRPTTGGPYHWVTKDNWWVSCVPAANTTGEGFLAIDPAGTKYWFTWMSRRNVGHVSETVEGSNGKPRRHYIFLQEVLFLATKIQDRFGNTVQIQYSNDAFARPLKITSNDAPTPREIAFAYNAQGFVSSVTDGMRTVRYGYATDAHGYSTLTSVTLPDNTQWLYNFKALSHTGAHSGFNPDHPCARPPDKGRPPLNSYDCVGWPVATASVAASVTHPSGARGDYLLKTHYQVTGAGGHVWSHPFGVVERTTTGVGLSPMKWTYAFGPTLAETQAQCRAGACPTRIWTDETGPDKKVTRRHFGVRANVDYGLMVRQQDGHVASGTAPTWLRDTTFAYRTGASIGVLPGEGQATAPLFTNMRQLPVADRVTSQDGATFAYKVESWDAFDRPLIVRRAGSDTRRDQTVYADNTALWVIGPVGRSIHLGTTNTVESETQYSASTALPTRTFAFGKLQKTFMYDARGNIAAVSDGRDTASFNTTVTYSGWKRGLPGVITHPDGTRRLAAIDNLGRVTSTTDENGYVTCHGYDAAGRLTRIDYPSDALNAGKETCGTDRWNPMMRTFARSTQAAFGLAAGHWIETVTTGNGRTETRFDAFWRPMITERFDATDKAATLSQVAMRYGADGQLLYQLYPTTGITSYTTTARGTRTTYDALGRAIRVEQDAEAPWNVLSAKTEYLSGFRVRTTNPMGKATTTSFKTYDTPATDWPVSIAHPMGVTTTITRDAFGKPTAITRAGGTPQIAATRHYQYNAHHELCRRAEPETGSTLMGYDAAGNLAWSASGASSTATCASPGNIPARTSTRQYDNRNRLIDLGFGDDTGEQTWTYTPDGLPKTITTYNGAGRTLPFVNAYSYNKRRMVGGQGETAGESHYTWSLGYGYDRNGAAANHVHPNGQIVDYAPNALGQATKAGAYATGVRYHPNGAVRQFTYGNGVIHAMEQNARQLPDRSRSTYGNTAIHDDNYDYDANANVLAISDGTPGNRGHRTMTYDDLDRLASATSPWFGGTIRYTYDALDNIQSVARPNGQSYRYCYNAQGQLAFLRNGAATACTTGPAATALTYDAQGNLFQKNEQRYTFTQDNRLRSVANKESYRYDGHGRRTLSYAPTRGNTNSLYGTDGVLRYMKDNGRARQEDYFYLAGSLVAIRETVGTTATIKYQHTDALGSPVAVTNAARAVVERSEREPYGKLLNRAMRDGPGFTGHVEDAVTGLTYMQQRYFDSQSGVFPSADPMAVDTTTAWNFNRYNYAANNPYKFKDPDGRAIDLVVDIGFIGYSGYLLVTQPSWTNAAALGADIAGAALPFATGLGAGVRAAENGVEASKSAGNIAQNAARGRAGEAAVIARLGDEVAGTQVTFKTSDGTRKRTDIVTTDKKVIEVKTGNARLSAGQEKLKSDIDNGRSVTPVGNNAKEAGLNPGEPTRMKSCATERVAC